MVLVSGAGGKTGQAVIAELAKRGVPIRAFLRQPRDISGAQAFVGDMTRDEDWATAARGCRKIYHICPNMHPDEVKIGRKAITAAQQANITHFVYHSVLHPQTQAMPHHWNKLLVEEMLLASGLPFTILQPTAYMQNIDLAQVRDSGQLLLPYGVQSQISLVDLEDVAAAAALVLTNSDHYSATYQLVGTAGLSQMAVAEILSVAFGRKITPREQTLEAWRISAEKANLPSYAINTLLAMFRYYDKHGLIGNPNTLRMLLNRPPTSIKSYCERAKRS